MSKTIGIQMTNALELATTVVRDSNGLILSGMMVGDTLYQNQYLILQAQKGEFKEYPTLGCGIDDMPNDEELSEWQATIREELAKDGMSVKAINITSTGMTLEAEYN